MLKFLIRGIFVFWLVVLGIVYLSNWVQAIWSETDMCADSMLSNAQMDIQHTREWQTTDNLSNCVTYEIRRDDYEYSLTKRKQIVDPDWQLSFNRYWGHVYRQLLQHEAAYLDNLMDSLMTIRNNKKLERNEFAHTIVSFVQDIPYTLVVTDCSKEDKAATTSCYDGGEWGILSPTEFLYTLKGDCDTRTVLLYVLLSQFGYDPLVMVSREYAHSMLALDIQAAGYSVMHRNTNHYFWETTNKGWQPGMIPPEMQNLDYWHIALYHEL